MAPPRVPFDDLLEFMVQIGTRDGQLDAAHNIKRVHKNLPEDAEDPVEYFHEREIEGSYHEVFTAIDHHVETWEFLARHERADIRLWAIVLLGLASGDRARSALAAVFADEPETRLRAECLLMLGLHESDDEFRALLAEIIAGDDPLLRFCAALTWLHTRSEPRNDAAAALLAVLTGEIEPEAYAGLFMTSGELAADAASMLCQLPPEESQALLTSLCEVLEAVDAVNAVRVTGALLDVVFLEAYDEDTPLTAPQRQAIAAIAESDQAWVFNANLHAVLRYNGLSTDREVLRSMGAS